MHGIMVPYHHSKPSTDAPASYGEKKQGSFRDSPFAVLRLQLVNTESDKRYDIDTQKIIKQYLIHIKRA